MKYSFTDVFSTYNAIVTLLNGLSDPENNHAANYTIKRWQAKLSDFEAKIINEAILENKKQAITAPYVIEYNNNRTYFIFTNESMYSVRYTKVQSMFRDIPNQVYLYINKDAFCFNLIKDIDEDMILRTYANVFSSTMIDQFEDIHFIEMGFCLFFLTLFLMTNSKFSKKKIKEFLEVYSLKDKDKNIRVDYTSIVDDVEELIEKKHKNIVNDYGYLDVNDFYLASKINEICDKYYYEDDLLGL